MAVLTLDSSLDAARRVHPNAAAVDFVYVYASLHAGARVGVDADIHRGPFTAFAEGRADIGWLGAVVPIWCSPYVVG